MATTGARGCGFRVKGGVYIETRLSPYGQPIENFLIDSPQVLDTQALGIRPRGMTPLLRDGTTHLFDWVGSDGYPNVADFIEEARHKGISRRVLPSLVADLTPDSRLLLIHPRAHVHNALDFWHALDASGRLNLVKCPAHMRGDDTNHPEIVSWALNSPDELPQPWCLGACYHDVIGKSVGGESKHPDIVQATVGDVTYQAHARPAMAEHVKYVPALFAAFPITNIAIIKDPDDEVRVNKVFQQVSDVLTGMRVFLEDA